MSQKPSPWATINHQIGERLQAFRLAIFMRHQQDHYQRRLDAKAKRETDNA